MPSDCTIAQLASEHIKMIVSGDFYMKPGWRYGPVQNPAHQIVYFPAGTNTRYVTPSRTMPLNKPCVIVTPSGETHAYEFDTEQPVRHLFITFAWEAGAGLKLQPAILDNQESLCIHAVEETIIPTLIKQILYLSSKKTYMWEERCKLLLAAALVEIEGLWGAGSGHSVVNMEQRRSSLIDKALDYMDKNLGKPITIGDIAKEIGWTHEHFTRKFVEYIGMTPQKAIMIRRIERACQLLVQETWSISQIAFAVGFQSVHYFYRAFVNTKGITAAQYREKYSSPHLRHVSVAEGSPHSYPVNKYFNYDSK